MTEKTSTTITMDELFCNTKGGALENKEHALQIELIAISEIDSFPNHPYQVRDDEEMTQLASSIKEQGILSPAIARKKDDGRYELIGGHRRKRACELLELETMPVTVCDLTNEQAAVMMVDLNCQREKVLPSEKAFAYKIKMEALSKQGKRTDLSSTPVVAKTRTGDELGRENGDSREQVRRYIRLTELIEPLLKMVDEKQIAFRPAVEISYLLKKEQKDLHDQMKREMCTPSLSQALKMKTLSQEKVLTPETIASIMKQQKPNQVEQLRIPKESISRFFKDDDNIQTITETITKALEMYRKRERSRDMER